MILHLANTFNDLDLHTKTYCWLLDTILQTLVLLSDFSLGIHASMKRIFLYNSPLCDVRFRQQYSLRRCQCWWLPGCCWGRGRTGTIVYSKSNIHDTVHLA